MICKRCGLRVVRWLNGWKHASSGANGKTPASRRHVPEPVTAPVDDSAAIIALLRRKERS
jgi:hypothetical protein